MNQKKWIIFLPILIIFGCGGGGDSTETTLNNESNSSEITVDNENNTSEKIVGYLIDSAVQGAKYICAETTAFTDKEGKFICTSLPIKFYIGELFLGEVTTLPSDSKVFPQDIIGVDRNNTSHPEVIKLATLLQSLDNDNNASNDINISTQTNESFENDESNTSLTDTTIADLSTINSNVEILDENQVEEHLTESTINAALPIGYTFPVINNQGQAIETTLNEYTIKLYANYAESANAQSNHRGVVVKINDENSPTMNIQSTYEGKSIVAGIYQDGKVVAVSKLLTVPNEKVLEIEIKF